MKLGLVLLMRGRDDSNPRLCTITEELVARHQVGIKSNIGDISWLAHELLGQFRSGLDRAGRSVDVRHARVVYLKPTHP